MKKYNKTAISHIYFIGIGGISMSGLAKLMLNDGKVVSGSDATDSVQISKLRKLGAVVTIGHNASNIDKSVDLVVYSSAIKTSNVERQRAVELGIPQLERSEYLGLISKDYKNIIAVSGTHGKTTTTAMLSEIFIAARLNPTVHIGGQSICLKSNTIIGGKDYLILEACEYKESFRFLCPTTAVVTNIEVDHVDYYKNLEEINSAFQKFVGNSREVVMLDGLNISHNKAQLVNKDWKAKHIEFWGNGYSFNVYFKGVFFETIRLNVLGVHNIINSLFAIAVAYSYGINKDIIVKALSNFQGVERRYETIKVFDSGCRLIIDYAHHPTEIKASIEGIKPVYNNILVIFQPHTYSRTKGLFNEFVEVLKEETLVIHKTYAARENVIKGGEAKDLYKALLNTNNKLWYTDNVNEMIKLIENKHKKYDCILLLGAGDLADRLKSYYK